MKNWIQFALSALLFLATACSSDNEEIQVESSKGQLISFSIEKDKNPDKILESSTASISSGSIILSLNKYDDLKSLVATFSIEGKKVTVNGTEQTSGVTANDYTQPLTFSIENEKGEKTDYTVKVVQAETTPLVSFRFLKKQNEKLTEDIQCTFSETTIYPFFSFPPTVLTPTFNTNALKVLVEGKEQESGVSSQDFSQPVVYTLQMRNGETYEYTVIADYMYAAVPVLRITTDEAGITEIPGKEEYLSATLEIDGQGVYEDFKGVTEIKGRGNSTWGYPKKPYRLKLDKKAELCGFAKAKNYVLLANYLDPTLMLNAVAFKIAQLLEMPFTNHAIPVDVFLNDRYKGSYVLTEQVEVKENRIDLDETSSVVWELDSYFDEDPKFTSDAFNLPVMLKDPDMSDGQFEYWKKDFNEFLNKFAKEPLQGNDYVDMIDIESVAKYLIVYNLTHNMEINHPKSIYLHKERGGKYVMGPVWDFDWAFDYEGSGRHFSSYNRSLWNASMNHGIGTNFFHRFLEDTRVADLYKQIWADFYSNKLDILLKYVEEYTKVLKPSALKDSGIWENTRSFETQSSNLKNWLKNRASWMNNEKI